MLSITDFIKHPTTHIYDTTITVLSNRTHAMQLTYFSEEPMF